MIEGKQCVLAFQAWHKQWWRNEPNPVAESNAQSAFFAGWEARGASTAPSSDRAKLIEVVRHNFRIGPIGPNSRDLLDRGGKVHLTPGEAGAIADSILAAFPELATTSKFRFTDAQWREYQALPEQGYSNRQHLEHVVNQWIRGEAI
ncbi:hypothetical protein [Leucobacter sp. NPDC077196]|uniref:hypothetical protein n=1 Tax=Leucobacter sp. NPDC077196 TaxID=3154959 RepID=UPI00343358B9